MKKSILYVLLNSNASFSISGTEHIDSIYYATNYLEDMNKYIKDNNIKLGLNHLYNNDYEYFTIIETEMTVKNKD